MPNAAPDSTFFSFITLSMSCHSLWRRQWHPTPVLLPGKFHGRRSLVGCRPWGREESDTTKRLHFHFSLSCIGEGNGNPLQRSCLQNPRDGGAWWATVYGVAQSRTRLKWLSSSSNSHSLLAWRVSIERSALILMGMLFVVFPLLLLIFALCVWSSLVWLICVLGSLSLGLSCLGLCVSWLGWLFPPPFKGNFQLLSPWIFSHGLPFFLFFFSSGTPMVQMLGV